MTVSTGWSLAEVTSLSLTPLVAAHCSATVFCWPTKLGSGGPALSTIVTGLGCGQEGPAPGLVGMTIPAGVLGEGTVFTLPGARPAGLIAPCASVSFCPVTCGMPIMCGPAETMRLTWPPRAIRDPFAGMVRMTRPLATRLSSTVLVVPGVRPALRRSAWAVAAETPVTFGTIVYRPSNSHQPSRPKTTSTARAAAREASLRLNNSRCSQDSPPGAALRYGASAGETISVRLVFGRYGPVISSVPLPGVP